MKIPFIDSLFKKEIKPLSVPDSILVKKLKELSSQTDISLYKDMEIYHHTKSFHIPLMMLDASRGLYIFEAKDWTFDELKNANIQKAENQTSSHDTLAFQNRQDIIRKKFNELTHSDGIPIFNYLLMENLNADEYEHLNDSFKELLPREKIIFSDSSQGDILKKLHDASAPHKNLCNVNDTMGTLLTQYAILDDRLNLYLCSDEQISLIDQEIGKETIIKGSYGSGKSSVLLLKTVVELFNNPHKKILIIKPTVLACDILKKKLLDIIEHGIIEVDLTSVEILTPLELLNKHQAKLGRETLDNLDIDNKLMSKSFNVADIIMCDDADHFSTDFIEYLKHLQKKSQLLLIYTDTQESDLNKEYRVARETISFHQTNPHAKALHIISTLLAKGEENIVLVSNSLSAQKLKDDLEDFIEYEPKIVDSSQHIINQSNINFIFCTYADLNELSAKHIILMDLCFTSENEIKYAFNLSTKSVHVLYEEDCQEINILKEYYESSKEPRRVGKTTKS
ncbi:hypothetical protein GJV85_10345 [Sulfurimonas aquatica]|uniref:Uncharacterized protein n=1 Tax=Sulfurimonas aquatica TaxID=2672570 RepID=A0A975B1H9_9BACT|nr:hypothetical protein [Sulfurimonas aquatica]QSZ42492.1 hypothetical protein GJV85_10345 [Sulfurimonas aquatica]